MGKTYAVLYNRKNITGEIFAFQPTTIIEGILQIDYYDKDDNLMDETEITEEDKKNANFVERFFCDGAQDYSLMDDLDQLDDASFDQVVGEIISEEELLERYKEDSDDIDEIKGMYYGEIVDKVCLGVIDEEKGILHIVKLDANDIKLTMQEDGADELQYCIAPYTIEGKVQANNKPSVSTKVDIPSKFKNKGDLVFMTKEFFLSLLSSKTLKEVMDKLQEIKKENDAFEEEKKAANVNGERIKEQFEKTCNHELNEEDPKNIKVIFKELSSFYTKLADGFREKNSDSYSTRDAEDKARYIAEQCARISRAIKMEIIKSAITKLYADEKENVELIAKTYDEVMRREAEKVSKPKETKKKTYNEQVDVKALKTFMDERVIGQEDAKKDVITAVAQNFTRDDPKNKISIMLVGPTGSGKTLLATTLGEYLDRPVEVIDTTQLSAPGYVGANIEDFLVDLYEKAGKDLEKAEHSIVVFDEIDKKGSKGNDDVSGRAVLNTLLPFIQGTEYPLSVGSGFSQRNITFNTKNLTIFATGAFTNVSEKTGSDKLYGESHMGFTSNLITDKSTGEDIKYRKFSREDIIKYGDMPAELMGRFSTVTQLHGHTVKSLRKILRDAKGSVLKSKIDLLKMYGVEVVENDSFIDKVAEVALGLKTGARSLNTIVEAAMKEAIWEVLYNPGVYSKLYLTPEMVTDPTNVVLETRTVEKDGVITPGEMINLKTKLALLKEDEEPEEKPVTRNLRLE